MSSTNEIVFYLSFGKQALKPYVWFTSARLFEQIKAGPTTHTTVVKLFSISQDDKILFGNGSYDIDDDRDLDMLCAMLLEPLKDSLPCLMTMMEMS